MQVHDPAPRRPLTRAEVRAALSFALLFMGLLGLELVTGASPTKLSMVFVLLAWLPMLVVHELGHALAARAVGWDVLEIVIGYGPELARFRLGRTLVAVRAIPIEGHVLPTPREASHARLKNAFVYAGGPGAELLVIAGIGAALGFETLLSRSSDLGVIALQSVALVATIGVVLNLTPHAMSGGASDGLGILISGWLSEAALAHKLALPYLTDAERAFDRDETAAAHAAVSAGLAKHPTNVPLLIMMARCEVALGEVERGHQRLEALRTQPGLAEAFEADRLHGAAAAALESGDPDCLEEAEAAAQIAVDYEPRNPDYLLTLGALQLERNRIARAEASLQAAYRLARTPLLEDRCLSYLALAAHTQGKFEQAQLFAQALLARTDSARLRGRVRPWAA